MSALVIYESMFGNNRDLAVAISEGIATRMEVTTVEVGVAPVEVPEGVTLLVVGGPTHAFGMTRPNSRRDAAKQAAPAPIVSARIGIREWLQEARVPSVLDAAAWDTRVERPAFLKLIDRSAEGMVKGLRRLGCSVVASPQHFAVEGTKGPLVAGEVEHARRWGEQLAGLVTSN